MINNIQEDFCEKNSCASVISKSSQETLKKQSTFVQYQSQDFEKYPNHEDITGSTNEEFLQDNYKYEKSQYFMKDKDNFRQHQPRSYCSLIRKNHTRLDSKLFETLGSNSQSSSVECSRRPIRCPRVDCAINVAFSSLTHHFIFDHPEVPIISVDPGSKNTLSFSFSTLPCESSRCLALLLVSGKLSSSTARLFNGSQVHPKYRNRLPLPILAARLHCTSRCGTRSCVTKHDESHVEGERKNCEGDVIIVWLAGLDIGSSADPLRCSIQAVDDVDNNEFRSMTYTGPVNSLRTAQCPQEVFLSGDCVTLYEGFVNHISRESSSLNVNVIVY
ncbi:uncharacterized protein [Prorops nasuta]|uniref:uncharacterized protein n=1 Tax=Prorops nasuta TaxID=863751 RepID=UPI0034CF7A32